MAVYNKYFRSFVTTSSKLTTNAHPSVAVKSKQNIVEIGVLEHWLAVLSDYQS